MTINLVTHYTEGTLMPLRVNGYIYSFIPDQAPFYMRPFVRMVANQLNNQLVEPALKVNLEFVSRNIAKKYSFAAPWRALILF